MKAVLNIRGGSRDGEAMVLPADARITFGRSPSCDERFDDDRFSRAHFSVEGKGSFFLLTDLQSSTGTTVNGKKVVSKILHSGDRIVAGGIEFSFKTKEAPTNKITADSSLPETDSTAKANITFEHNYEDGSFELADTERALDKKTDTKETTPELLGRTRTALQTVYHVGNLVYTQESLDRVCHTIMDTAMEVIGPDRGFLVMYDPDDKFLEPIVIRRKTSNGNGARTSTRILRAVDDELTLCRPIILYSVKKGLAVISGNVYPETGDANSKHIKSALCVPVRTNTDIIGAIYLDRVDSDEPFHAHQLELLSAVGRQAGIAIERARMLEDMEGLFYSCVRALVSSIEAKDQYTHGHSERVTAFAVTLAEEMALDAETLDNVRLGALLHDVGKIGVAEKILTKPSRLTPDEVKIIRHHPARGAEILSHIRNIPGVIAAVKHHHEMYNGLGYPDGLVGEEIPQTARIVALADAFDAMTSNRSYRRNFDVEEAISEFTRCSGDQFDPEVCEVMIKLLENGKIIPCNELFAKGIDISQSIY
ncbi:MAG: HD domain-containing phosphohydrolase [Planctomycetota bacterium]|jgi:putative nucleotidyltransferase with HDIG domain